MPVNSNLRVLRNYVRDFATAQGSGVLNFNYGTAARLHSASRSSTLKYPVLHLERPNVVPENNEMANYTSYFMIVVNVFAKFSTMKDTATNDESQWQAEEIGLDIMEALCKKLNHDSKSGLLIFDLNGCQLNPIPDEWIDKTIGWQLIAKVGINANSKFC